MKVLKVGDKYLPNYANNIEKALIIPGKKMFELAIYLNASLDDILIFKNNKIRYSVFQHNDSVFLLIDFLKGFSFDAPFNILKIKNELDIESFLLSDANLLTIVLIDARTNVIKKIRTISLKKQFIDNFKKALSSQLKSSLKKVQHDEAIAMQLYSTDKMFNQSKIFYL